MTVELFPSDKLTPEQVLIQINELEGITDMAIVYFKAGEPNPLLTCSSMSAMRLHWMGAALGHYALGHLD